MSSEELALLKGKCQAIEAENAYLKNNIRVVSATQHASRMCIDEYVTANINLRASISLMDESLAASNKENLMLRERIKVLEKENNELIELNKSKENKESEEITEEKVA